MTKGISRQRSISDAIKNRLGQKIILLMGPRQVGKTTLAKSLETNNAYYNYDIRNDRSVFQKQEWDTDKRLVIFDELHKMKKWKLWLKGLYDEGRFDKQSVLVTGSARLDIAKKMGDSLAGRFFSFRLYPFDLKELRQIDGSSRTESNYQRLILKGGFPEPFFNNDQHFAAIWRNTHSDIILKQDLLILENIRDIDGIESLVELLSERVGSPISYNSLAEDLDRDDKTIKKWLTHLENMYVVFRVSPYSKNWARSIKKAGKYYFYDIGKINGDESQKLENLVALSLKKEIDFQEDCRGIRGHLNFLRTKDGKEIDFIVRQKDRITRLIEVKLSDATVSPSFDLFSKLITEKIETIQIVKNLDREFTNKNNVKVKSALSFLESLDFK